MFEPQYKMFDCDVLIYKAVYYFMVVYRILSPIHKLDTYGISCVLCFSTLCFIHCLPMPLVEIASITVYSSIIPVTYMDLNSLTMLVHARRSNILVLITSVFVVVINTLFLFSCCFLKYTWSVASIIWNAVLNNLHLKCDMRDWDVYGRKRHPFLTFYSEWSWHEMLKIQTSCYQLSL